MSATRLHIGLAAWIIQDGNYVDFVRGTTRRFALEFYSEKGLMAVSQGFKLPSLVHKRDGIYDARGTVCFTAANVWVIDFGGVMAFGEEPPPSGMVPGVTVSGEVYLGVDPFSYFERLFRVDGVPPLIYEWAIDEIEIETAPIIDSPDGRTRERDKSKLKRVAVAETDAWNDDDGGNADYLLVCQRTSAAATWTLLDG